MRVSGCSPRRRGGRAPVVMSTCGSRSSRFRIDRTCGWSAIRPIRFRSSSKRLCDSSRPERSKAYVSPDVPNRATFRMRVKVRSGRIRKPSAATTRPSSPRIGAATNMVGTPTRSLPSRSASITTEGKGRETVARPASAVATNSASSPGYRLPRSVARDAATMMPSGLNTANPSYSSRSIHGPSSAWSSADLGRAEQGRGVDIPRRGEFAGERPDLRVVGGDQGQLLMGPEQDADRLDVGVEQGPELAGHLGPHDPLDGRSEPEARDPEDGGGDRRPDPQLLAEDLACRGEGSDKTPRSIQDRHRSGRHGRESEWGDRRISGVSVFPRNLNLDR